MPTSRANVAVLLTLGLLAPLAFFLTVPSAEAATNRVLTIWNGTAHPRVPFKTFDSNPPKVFDINGDGKKEIIAQNDNQWVYVFDSQTGKILFQSTTKFPSSWGARSMNGPEVAITQQGGAVRLIVANSAAYITSFRYDPSSSTNGNFGFVKEWERRATDCYSNPGMDAKPVLADLDRDGKMEILAMTEERGIIALRSNGALYWKNCMGGGNGDPAVADLTGDGWPEVIAVTDGSVVASLNGRTGGFLWSYRILNHFNLRSGSISVGPGIGQLDGVGGPDIVVAARDSHDLNNYENDHALVVALSSSGKKLWHYQDPQGNPLNYCHPVIVDADRNGVNEVYWADWNTIGHKGGVPPEDSWQTTGPANFYRFTNTGQVVWRQTLNTYWNNKDLALADVDADGTQEVLANGPGSGGDGIWYLDSRTGAKETFIVTSHWKVARGAIVADLWNTGTMQWFVPAGAADSTVSGGGILVYDTHVAYNSAYPHLPYPSFTGAPVTTNPTTSMPPPTTTPTGTGGTFPATFSVPPGINNWWVEVKVTSSHTVTKVEAKTNAGAWVQLNPTDWGTWAKSYNVPSGSQVVFRATDTGGATATSQAFTWP